MAGTGAVLVPLLDGLLIAEGLEVAIAFLDGHLVGDAGVGQQILSEQGVIDTLVHPLRDAGRLFSGSDKPARVSLIAGTLGESNVLSGFLTLLQSAVLVDQALQLVLLNLTLDLANGSGLVFGRDYRSVVPLQAFVPLLDQGVDRILQRLTVVGLLDQIRDRGLETAFLEGGGIGVLVGRRDGESGLALMQDRVLHLRCDVDGPDFFAVVQHRSTDLAAPLLHILVHELGNGLIILDLVALSVLIGPAVGLLLCGGPGHAIVAALRGQTKHVLHHVLVVGVGGSGEGNFGRSHTEAAIGRDQVLAGVSRGLVCRADILDPGDQFRRETVGLVYRTVHEAVQEGLISVPERASGI